MIQKYIGASGSNRSSSQRKHKAAIKLQTRRRSQNARRDVSALKSAERKKRSATKKIQSKFRGKKTRRNLAPIKAQRSAERLLEEFSLNTLLNIKGKTAKNFDNKLKVGNFRRVNLEGKNLASKKLHNVDFAYANFKRASLTGAKFNDSILVSANFDGAKIADTIFLRCNLKNANLSNIKIAYKTNFTDANLTNARIINSYFDNVDFTGANMLNTNIQNTELYRPIFINAQLNKTKFINCTLRMITFNDVYNKRLSHVNFSDSKFIQCDPFQSLIFDKCIFTNAEIMQLKFTGIDFHDCVFHNTKSKLSRYTDVIFQDCEFINNNMQQSDFTDVVFINCKFDTTIFSGSKFNNCTFETCDLNSSDFSSFVSPHITVLNDVEFNKCEMKNVAFNSVALLDMNFNHLMLDGASFTGSDLTGSTFVWASLRGSNFYWTDLNRTDFTDAIINEHTNFTDARGMDDNTRGLEARLNVGRAVDTHKAWANINMGLLNDFFNENNVDCSNYPKTNDAIKSFLNRNLTDLLMFSFENTDETPRKKIELKQQLDTCFTDVINQFDRFFSPANNTTTKTISEMLTCSIGYINNQPEIFKNIYIISVITDILAGHGAHGKSCPKGAIERLITYIASSAHTYIMTYDDTPTQEQSEKIAEYKNAIKIIENSDELRLDGFRKEWFDDHREPADAIPARTSNGTNFPRISAITGGPNAFPEDMTIDEKMENYNQFLRHKFGLHLNMFNQQQIDEYEDLIKNDKTNGVDAVKENLENYIYFLGGKRK